MNVIQDIISTVLDNRKIDSLLLAKKTMITTIKFIRTFATEKTSFAQGCHAVLTRMAQTGRPNLIEEVLNY